MFRRLKSKWKVNWWQLVIIIICFALGGSLCGYLGRKLIGLFNIESWLVRVPLYIIVVTVLWPFCVLAISIPFGQFGFFRRYIGKLIAKFSGGASK